MRSGLANPQAIVLLAGGAIAAAAVLVLAGAPASAVVLVAAGAVLVPVAMTSIAAVATGRRPAPAPVPVPNVASEQPVAEPVAELESEPSSEPDAVDEFLAFFEGEEAPARPAREAPAASDDGVWAPPSEPVPLPPLPSPVLADARPVPEAPRPADPEHAAADADVFKRALDQCRLAFRRHPVPTIAFDQDGSVTMMNDAARLLLHATTSAGATIAWPELLPLHDSEGSLLPASAHPVARALAGETVSQAKLSLQNDELHGVTVDAVPLVSRRGDSLGAVVSLHPVGGHSPLTALDRLIWDRPEAALVIDSDGKLVAWNPAAERALLYMRTEVLGRGADLLSPHGSPSEGRIRLEDIDARAGSTHGRVAIHAGDDGEREFVVVASAPDAAELLAHGADRSAYDGHVVCVLYPLDSHNG